MPDDNGKQTNLSILPRRPKTLLFAGGIAEFEEYKDVIKRLLDTTNEESVPESNEVNDV